MPVHDWSRVEAGIFHDFHYVWIAEIRNALNAGLLPPDYYAMAEQRGPKFEADVLTLRSSREDVPAPAPRPIVDEGRGVVLAEPRVRVRAETDLEYYRRKQNVVAVRHVSGDELVAVIEVLSRGNKSGRKALDDFVNKSIDLLNAGVHLLILDLHPPTPRDPHGIHGRIWEEMTGQTYTAPADKPLTLAAYESDGAVRAFVEPIALGDSLTPMPLFLRPGGHLPMPLEETYTAAWEAVPRRWRDVIAAPGPVTG